MITLETPAMALNDSQISRVYQMWNTRAVQNADTCNKIIDDVTAVAGNAPSGKLKHVVFNCHGVPGTMLMGGQPFNRNNTGLFARWRGLVEKMRRE